MQGLEVKAWERRYVKAVAAEKPIQVVKILSEERTRVNTLWVAEMEKIHQEVMAFKDDTIPIVVMPATGFDQGGMQDTNNELDEDLL